MTQVCYLCKVKQLGLKLREFYFIIIKGENKPWFECCLDQATYLTFAYPIMHSLIWRIDS